MPNALTSIIVPTHNRRDLLLETVGSCYLQGVPVEVIVVDDGSDDGSAAAVRGAHPDALVLEQTRQGAQVARNRGMAAANGAFVKFLDSDDLLAPGMLARQLAAAEDASADVVYGDFEMVGELGDRRVGGRPSRATGPQEDMVASLLGDWWCAPFCYLYRREALAGHQWREELACLQDFDFVLRVAMAGRRFSYCPGVDGFYRIHSGQITQSSRLKYARNRRLVLDGCLEQLQAGGGASAGRKQMLAHGYWSIAQAAHGVEQELFVYARGRVHELGGRCFFPRFWGTLPVRLMTWLLGIGATESMRGIARAALRRRP